MTAFVSGSVVTECTVVVVLTVSAVVAVGTGSEFVVKLNCVLVVSPIVVLVILSCVDVGIGVRHGP